MYEQFSFESTSEPLTKLEAYGDGSGAKILANIDGANEIVPEVILKYTMDNVTYWLEDKLKSQQTNWLAHDLAEYLMNQYPNIDIGLQIEINKEKKDLLDYLKNSLDKNIKGDFIIKYQMRDGEPVMTYGIHQAGN